ncbi:flagellar biosynthetic protein FliO [Clostridium sp.]|uniref:flagellar biosynthetic protein FliO n=1 Tax=Clostridium sp. TaxID=1506 RepID=UPI002637617F|nr:flagellar biosynthetic protein FliO [Clostridium sp.]
MIELIKLIIQLVFALALIFLLMYLLTKLSGNKLDKINENKYITVIERTNISKDTSILLLKVGEKGYIISANNNNVGKLQEISKEEMTSIIDEKKRRKEVIAKGYESFINNIVIKLKNIRNKKD